MGNQYTSGQGYNENSIELSNKMIHKVLNIQNLCKINVFTCNGV